MKILHITTLDLTAYVFLLPLFETLKKENWEVELACTETNWTEKIRQKGFNVIPIYIDRKINLLKDFISFKLLFDLIKTGNYNIVHTHTSKAGFIGRLAAFKAKTSLILHTCHGLAADSANNIFLRKLYFWLEKIAAKKSNHIIAVSDDLKKDLIKHSIVSADKVTTIHNGIDLQKFKIDKPKELIKKELNLPNNAPIIGIIGRIEKQKGHIYFIKAASKILKKFPEAIFIIVGTGYLKQRLENLVKKLGLERNIYFLGYRENIPEILSILDIFVYPSLWEGFGMGVLEAMASGVPIAASSTGGILDLIQHNHEGLLVPKGEFKQLALAILELLSNPQKAQTLASNAKIKAINNFSQGELLKKYLELYKELIFKNLKV
ncbi:MAG: glycosyltransferase family 4 protein [Armatimonadetes bacterium]|nr:glycosyltransferase family 4 protein [Armatimonadota bacterium]